LTDEEIQENYKTYKDQASIFLDFSKIKVIKNSNIISKIDQKKLLKVFSKISVSEVLQREDFRKRLENNW
jgi:tyrosyl-tRNA synthetase